MLNYFKEEEAINKIDFQMIGLLSGVFNKSR